MPTGDPWRQKAGNLANKARQKGGVAVVWLDGEPVDEPTRVQARSMDRDWGDALVGMYEPSVRASEIYDDLMDDLARAVSETDAHPSEEGGREAAEPSSVPGPEPASHYEPEPEPESPETGGEVAEGVVRAVDFGWASCKARATDATTHTEPPETANTESPEPARPNPTPEPSPAYPEADIKAVQARLYTEWAQAHRAGRHGRRDLWGELITKLEEVTGPGRYAN